MKKQGDDEEKQKMLKQISVFITVPFILAVPPLVGWLIGHWLDKYFGTQPIFTSLMIFCGIVAGIREFYRVLKKYGEGI